MHKNIPCLNLGTCCVLRHLHHFKAKNFQAFIGESLDNVLPKLNSVLKVVFDFLHFAKDFAQNHAKENGTVQKYTTKFFSH